MLITLVLWTARALDSAGLTPWCRLLALHEWSVGASVDRAVRNPAA
jgi:hypothetical protein